jgi:hypothetical protein
LRAITRSRSLAYAQFELDDASGFRYAIDSRVRLKP